MSGKSSPFVAELFSVNYCNLLSIITSSANTGEPTSHLLWVYGHFGAIHDDGKAWEIYVIDLGSNQQHGARTQRSTHDRCNWLQLRMLIIISRMALKKGYALALW